MAGEKNLAAQVLRSLRRFSFPSEPADHVVRFNALFAGPAAASLRRTQTGADHGRNEDRRDGRLVPKLHQLPPRIPKRGPGKVIRIARIIGQAGREAVDRGIIARHQAVETTAIFVCRVVHINWSSRDCLFSQKITPVM